jgi:hypothetical protein
LANVSLRVPIVRLGLAAVLALTIGLTTGLNGATATESRSDPAEARVATAEVAATTPAVAAKPRPLNRTFADAAASTTFAAEAWSDDAVGAIDARVLSLALGAARCATTTGTVVDPSTLTIIDYSKASTEPRMWVLDLEKRALLYEELVAHGQGSGGNFATKFSNRADSHQTSLGLFVTETTYGGRNGYSLRLDGLEPGFNDRARERAIVMHGAPYVNDQISKGLGRLGRSHGCPAVREPIARELIDRVKGGSLVFAYYPDANWLENSKFLSGCS